jgi:hypothetical protein
MSTSDQYRKNAANAQACADTAISDIDRAAWLQVAEGWLRLLRRRPTEEDGFKQEITDRETRQDISVREQ